MRPHGVLREPAPQVTGAQEGRIRTVDAAAAEATFTIPDYSEAYSFGPAPYTPHESADPTPGDRCLVVFVGTGVDRPWIVAWVGS